MPKKKHNAYLSPKEIISTLSSPLRPLSPHFHSYSHFPSPSHPRSNSSTTQPSLSIFDIPLIFDQICTYLSNDDILTCMRVCKQWNVFAVPHHWRTIRFRTPSCIRTNVSPPCISSAQMEQLRNVAPRVRSLSVDLSNPGLLFIPFSGLTRLCLQCENAHKDVTPLHLMGLLYRNTRLRELKIEVASWLVRFFDDRTLQFLCSSSLRSLDLDQLDHYELPMTQALVGHCPDTLEKLRLGFLEYHDKNAHKCHDARETAVPRILPNLRCLTVECMRIDNQLEIVLCDLIQSCPNLQELNLHRLHRLLPTTIPNIVAALIKYCPGLNSFHSPRFPAADMLRLIEGCPRIHTLEMEIRQEHLEHVIPSLALRYSSTLQVFRITENHLPPDQDNYISTILAHCACLKVMSIHATTYGIPLQDLIKVEWATTSLESLSLTIRSPAPALDQELLHREWKEQRYGYVDPDGGDPENQIAQAARLANMVLQFYTRIEAQPRLISPWMSWFNGWRSIPWEFAEEFTDGQLTEERQCKMSLYLPSIRKLDAHIRHAAKDKLDRDKERCLKEKLDLCNISVIDLERTAQSRDLHALAHLRSALDYTPLYMREINEAKDVAIAGDTAAEDSLPSDHEYSSYKSRNRRSSNNAKNKSRVCA